ncbi:MAG: hypothetical protein GX541_08485 [Clostridiales bacterium]|jgi:hypothetical protein|nr:hypothetical protein [Clostridiales bacterium]
MKFSVGYQLSEEFERDFFDIVCDYKERISEVYFPWLDNATGRGSLVDSFGYFDWSVQNKLVYDLKRIKELGIKLNLLYNGNCYGADAISRNLSNRIYSIIDYLSVEGCGIDVITTASPAIAHMVKSKYGNIDVRASVNMRIGTVKGMSYLAHLFDSYYIQRDYNRDFTRIKELKEWADKNNKGLYLLANSGCMRFCSCQTFHDNMVAHNGEIERQRNIEGFMPYACWNYLKSRENLVSVLQNTWIRPEDIHNYKEYFPTIKLATRMHTLPALVIDSYASGRYSGNLLDLFEPGFGPAFAPYIIDNSRFPDDWFERTTACDKKCEKCGYCSGVLDMVLVDTGYDK